jgi:hypothetical protein
LQIYWRIYRTAPHYFSSVPGSFLTLKIYLRGKTK